MNLARKPASTLINNTLPPRERTLGLWMILISVFPSCPVEVTCWVSAGTSEWEEPRSLTGHKAVWADTQKRNLTSSPSRTRASAGEADWKLRERSDFGRTVLLAGDLTAESVRLVSGIYSVQDCQRLSRRVCVYWEGVNVKGFTFKSSDFLSARVLPGSSTLHPQIHTLPPLFFFSLPLKI